MNKEEIEKGDKEHLIEVLTEYKNYIFEFDDDNIKVEYILDYIRELEFQNTALKAEHNHNITRIKELEQKETILDKVTEKLKDLKEIALEDKEQRKIIELPNGIKYKDKVISLDTFIFTIENLLEIIEGEKE